VSTWATDDLDLEGYLARVGVPLGPPTREALDELHEAHERTFTFDNLDVLLDQHPGVSLAAISEKFVGRGRGGYCFEHSTLFAAVLSRLGYSVTRRLGRVGDPTEAARTHMVVAVDVEDERVVCDPGFGLTLLRPLPLRDGASTSYGGWSYRLRAAPAGEVPAWELLRLHDDEWELMHTHDELPVHPVDVVAGHHFTSTWPESHFRHGLMVTKHLADRHVSVTHSTVTIRRPGSPTEHREIAADEVVWWLSELEVPLSADEVQRLRVRLASLT
jgi:N-hydroxyarylamine O-acetyltransferase